MSYLFFTAKLYLRALFSGLMGGWFLWGILIAGVLLFQVMDCRSALKRLVLLLCAVAGMRGDLRPDERREDEIGTPFCITVDFDTVGDEAKGIAADNAVTIRERDSMEQVRVPISELKSWLEAKLAF